jgi:excinuclease ABC subunit B
MRKAMDETARRREKQIAFNAEHGITPTTIRKRIADVMEGAYANAKRNEKKGKGNKVAEEGADYRSMSPAQAVKTLKQLEEKMFALAKNLEFEKAAAMRDEIAKVRAHVFGLD